MSSSRGGRGGAIATAVIVVLLLVVIVALVLGWFAYKRYMGRGKRHRGSITEMNELQ